MFGKNKETKTPTETKIPIETKTLDEIVRLIINDIITRNHLSGNILSNDRGFRCKIGGKIRNLDGIIWELYISVYDHYCLKMTHTVKYPIPNEKVEEVLRLFSYLNERESQGLAYALDFTRNNEPDCITLRTFTDSPREISMEYYESIYNVVCRMYLTGNKRIIMIYNYAKRIVENNEKSYMLAYEYFEGAE